MANTERSTSNTRTENKSTSNNTYGEEDVDKIDLLLARTTILQDKISIGSINKMEK